MHIKYKNYHRNTSCIFMVIFAPEQFAKSCGLAYMSYLLWKSEQEILWENPHIFTVEKLNFVWLYCPEIVEILEKYGFAYTWWEYHVGLSSYLEQEGTIIYKPGRSLSCETFSMMVRLISQHEMSPRILILGSIPI